MPQLSKQIYSEGVHDSVPERVIGDRYGDYVMVDISDHTDPDVLLRVDSWYSLDDGGSWLHEAFWTHIGGEHFYRDGTRKTEIPWSFASSASRGKGVLNKITMTLSNIKGDGPVKQVPVSVRSITKEECVDALQQITIREAR